MLNNLGKRIRAARESAGFTQESLSEAIGVSRSAVARWENNDIEPKIENLICLSEVLRVSTDSLLGIPCYKSNSLSYLTDDAIFALERFIEEVRFTKDPAKCYPQ